MNGYEVRLVGRRGWVLGWRWEKAGRQSGDGGDGGWKELGKRFVCSIWIIAKTCPS